MYDSWNTKCDGQNVFVIWDHFLPFYLPNNLTNQNFEKNEKTTLRYYHFTHVYHKWHSYDVWFLKYREWQTEFFVFLNHFLPFYPSNNPKKSKFWKNLKKKDTWRYYHFTQVYHKQQLYDVWLLRYEAWQTEFFVIWDHFLPFYPLTTQEIKVLKKMKKLPRDIITLHTCTTNDNHMMYGSWNIERDKQIFFVFSNHFLPFYPPNNPPKNKNAWRYYHFTQV